MVSYTNKGEYNEIVDNYKYWTVFLPAWIFLVLIYYLYHLIITVYIQLIKVQHEISEIQK